jgi:hypothetical protein
MRKELLPLILIGFAACDKIDHPITVGGSGPGNGNEGVTKRVLLEEFTAWHCIYCPEGHQIGQQLQGTYGDDLVIVGIHASDLADPGYYPTNTDFRTAAGDAYYTNWSVIGIPKGMVNRVSYEGVVPMERVKWSEATAAQMGLPAKMDLWFDALTYDGGNTVDASIKIGVAEALGDTTYKLVVYLIEDHVIDWQFSSLASPNDVEFYDHRHVLRDNLNGTWGQDVLTSANVSGDTVSVVLPTYTFNEGAGEDFVGANCALVAYLYNGTTMEVEQVAERVLVP